MDESDVCVPSERIVKGRAGIHGRQLLGSLIPGVVRQAEHVGAERKDPTGTARSGDRALDLRRDVRAD